MIMHNKKIITHGAIYALSIVLTLIFQGCAIGPVHGTIYTNTRFAGEFNPNNDVASLKSAKGCIQTIMGVISFGNASAGDIAKSSGINRISSVDHSTMTVLDLQLFRVYGQYCTIVNGE